MTAIEFVGTVGVALWGLRSGRNALAFALAVGGAVLLIDIPSLVAGGPAVADDRVGVAFAVPERRPVRPLHRARPQNLGCGRLGGVERRGAAMAVACLMVRLIGFVQALQAFGVPLPVRDRVALESPRR